MANIMSMVKLQNKPSRNAFDLSRKVAYSAKVAELLPVECIECLPGDKFKVRKQHFTRTLPVNTAAYTRIREYYDWFFVPTNLLWNKFNTFVTQMSDNNLKAQSIDSSSTTGNPPICFSNIIFAASAMSISPFMDKTSLVITVETWNCDGGIFRYFDEPSFIEISLIVMVPTMAFS